MKFIMDYNVKSVCTILQCRGQIVSPGAKIEHLLTDSRNVVFGENSLFFAIPGKNHDGHHYLEQAHKKGIKNFVVERLPDHLFSDSNFLLVNNSIEALQQLAAHHRNSFEIPVIGITGSNGKTIVKEWIYHLLKIDLDILRSPKSYNSKIGVPISIWEMDNKNELAIFEAGISTVDEMLSLGKMISPDIGIITNITKTHSEGFADDTEKTKEKLKLFTEDTTIIYRKDYIIIDAEIKQRNNIIHWSTKPELNADISVKDVEYLSEETLFTILYHKQAYHFSIPFNDSASFENAVHALIAALYISEKSGNLNESRVEHITTQAKDLPTVSMRMELKKGLNNCILINDAYSADIASLDIALRFLSNHSDGLSKTVILSDFDQSGLSPDVLYKKIASLLHENDINRFIGIGENIFSNKNYFSEFDPKFFPDTNTFIQQFSEQDFQNEIILLKGARRFTLEKISNLLSLKTHGTVLKIHLDHLVHNLNLYRSILHPGVKTMVMVKAFSYGSGQSEIARLLAHHRVDYLAVAYADEGVELRRQGIKLPIMVMNPEPETFAQIIHFQLEPEIYSFRILKIFIDAFINRKKLTEENISGSDQSKNQSYLIHLKLDTGMHRLGFEEADIDTLIDIIKKHPQLKIASIFSHLASADDISQNDFSELQIQRFTLWSEKIIKAIAYPVIRHLINSPGITKFRHAQFDMVRLGIGLYGVDPSSSIQNSLKPVSSLHTTIAQIKHLQAGESVGYGRSFTAEKNMRIATINIGYADGFSRKMSNGRGSVVIANKIVPVLGRVCMDMTMVDVSSIDGIKEGDEVEIFGNQISIVDYAQRQETIAYEVMTSVSQRIKRVYLQE